MSVRELVFDMKKWFSPNGLVINADSLNYYALPDRIRIAKGTEISMGEGKTRDGEDVGGHGWLQADVIGIPYGVTIVHGINPTFMFSLDGDYVDRVGLLKDKHGENIVYFDILSVDSDKCQILPRK